ncbi:hypothetical protein ACIRD3_20160 [Kitasatospora sp. NPDC093550]|uniref:hypothetical protein n=1 Tax=Kitasatospora sp. NPDC093550 TaxID=3364089 RepID=UPI003830A0CD
MTVTTGAPPARRAPMVLALVVARGFLTGGVIGASSAAFVVGIVIERVPLIVAGTGLPVAYGLLYLLAGAPRRVREAAAPPRTALALIEGLEAAEVEVTDVPVRFDLTVAPQDAPAYRVGITADVHVAELPDYRPGGVLVVRYPPDRPGRVRIVKRPTPEWEERAAGARIDSAPGPAVPGDPPEGGAVGVVGLLGLLLGAAAVVLLFRADLFGGGGPGPDSAQPSVSTTSSAVSSTVLTAGSGTVTLGPGQSMLEVGEMRWAVDSVTQGRDAPRALTLTAQDQALSVAFAPTGVGVPQFDPRSLPFEAVPALVREAGATLGVDAPRSWQLTADRLTGALVIRITVTGPGGAAASLEADERGTVVRRSPAH